MYDSPLVWKAMIQCGLAVVGLNFKRLTRLDHAQFWWWVDAQIFNQIKSKGRVGCSIPRKPGCILCDRLPFSFYFCWFPLLHYFCRFMFIAYCLLRLFRFIVYECALKWAWSFTAVIQCHNCTCNRPYMRFRILYNEIVTLALNIHGCWELAKLSGNYY